MVRTGRSALSYKKLLGYLWHAASHPLEYGQKPRQPFGHFQGSFLCFLQVVVIGLSPGQDGRAQGIEPDRLSFRLSERAVGDGARHPAVAVVKWVQGDEPQVG